MTASIFFAAAGYCAATTCEALRRVGKFLRGFLEAWTGVAREKPAPVVTPAVFTASTIITLELIPLPHRCFNCTEELPEGVAWKYCDKCVLAVEEARVMYRQLAKWEGLR